MKITANTWQQTTNRTIYKTDQTQEKTPAPGTAPDTDTLDKTEENPEETAIFLQNLKKDQEAGLPWSMPASDKGTSSKIKASVPNDSVGQLAAELANGHTKFDVLQTSSKAMRALANLRMAGAVSEGEDKEKIDQMIRRMNRLLKRIRTKMRHLEKEEQLEKRQERAEEKKEEQKARALQNELRGKRNKRRREEQDYAQKELANSNNSQGASPAAAFAPNTAAASPAAEIPDAAGAAISASAPISADIAVAAESVSVDITV